MKVSMNPRNASVSLQSVSFQSNQDFLAEIMEKEVINPLQKLSKSFLKEMKDSLIEIKTTFESTLKLMMTNKHFSVAIPMVDPKLLPPELLNVAAMLIGGLMAAITLSTIVASLMASFYDIMNKPTEADKWRRNIRKGFLQALITPTVIGLLALVVHFFLSGTPFYQPIWKNMP